MNVKSVIAGEYTAPPENESYAKLNVKKYGRKRIISNQIYKVSRKVPAQGPITKGICGITPEALTLR